MCGIVGFQLFKRKNNPENTLGELMSLLNHRGPDDSGNWIDTKNKIYLGHTRLSIIDLSHEGRQPMQSFDGRYIIVFNGEIYNYKKMKVELNTKKKSNLGSVSDTRVLIEYIASFGLKKTLASIEGMFAFMLWDKKKKEIFLSRDIYGEKPLFYFCDNDSLIFSSELKCIKRFLSTNLRIDEESSKLYACLGYIPAPLTIYKEVFKVIPGELVTIKDGIVMKKEKFFDFTKVKTDLISTKEDIFYKTDRLIDESVKKMMIADVEIGSFLSGGIDSSLTTAIMQKYSRKKIKTFSIGFNEKQYDESKFAKSVANFLNTDHHELIISNQDLISNIEKVCDIYDEPFGDSSFLPTFLLSNFASKEVKVVLSGDGGDETFLGYNRYLYATKFELFNKKMPKLFRNLFSNGLGIIPSGFYDSVSYPFLKLLGIHGFSSKIKKIRELMDFSDPIEFYKKLNIIDNSYLDFFKQLNLFHNDSNIVRATQINDILFYLSNDILVKVDRASMANSLEVRSPFLDRKLANQVLTIPTQHLLKKNQLKPFLKNKLSKFLPKKLFDRPKMGFAIPLDRWFNDKKLKVFFDQVFFDSNWDRLYMDKTRVQNIWKEYKKFSNRPPATIWNYAVAGIWLDNKK